MRESARGESCQVRIPGVCSRNPETVVLAHLNGGGMGKKRLDLHAAYCCSDCHDAADGRKRTIHDADTIKLWFLEGVIRTQEIMVSKGLVSIRA